MQKTAASPDRRTHRIHGFFRLQLLFYIEETGDENSAKRSKRKKGRTLTGPAFFPKTRTSCFVPVQVLARFQYNVIFYFI
jgi:hypothetical protein